MAPVIISNDMTAALPYGITKDSSHIETLHIPGLSKQSRHIHIYPKMKTTPLISLVCLFDYRCTITLDNKYMSVPK